jgi:hypothetical protein
MSGQKTAEELAQELYEHRGDPGEWDDEAVPLERRRSNTAVISVRLPQSEYRALRQAAQAAGESLSDYVRGAIAQRHSAANVAFLHDSSHLAQGYRVDLSTPIYHEHSWNPASPAQDCPRRLEADR